MADDPSAPRVLYPLRGPDRAGEGRAAPATHFVVLGHPRSGSTLLVQALREHPGMCVYGELFQDEPEARRTGYGARRGTMYETGTDGASFLADTIFRENDDPETLATGFKLFYTQGRTPGARSAWGYLIGRKDLRVIHLTRDSGLRAFVSLCEAEASGRWLVEPADTPPAGAPIHIDPQRCLAFLDSLYAYREWVRRAFAAHERLELSYERHLVADFDTALADVQTFLGVPALRLPALLRRQGTRPLEERISNYGEIRDLLRRTIHRC
jgi:LPS sulfotransferase NodH